VWLAGGLVPQHLQGSTVQCMEVHRSKQWGAGGREQLGGSNKCSSAGGPAAPVRRGKDVEAVPNQLRRGFGTHARKTHLVDVLQ